MSENTAVELYQIAPTDPLSKRVLVRAINELQSPRTDIDPALRQSLMQRVRESGVIFWDEKRGLFWVKHPLEGMQVAVWLMDAAIALKPGSEA